MLISRVAATLLLATGPIAAGAEVDFTLESDSFAPGASLPADFTCDGAGSSPALAWSGAPAGTREFAVLMSTQPGDGTTKWNWVLFGIPAAITSLPRDTFGIGLAGIGSDGPAAAYQPPCSEGPGAKVYTLTVYALSDAPLLPFPATEITGSVLEAALRPIILAQASLRASFSRTGTGSSAACTAVRNSTRASMAGLATVSCDASYAYIASDGLAAHVMMDGISATNLQVPIAQNFRGSHAWRIPLAPALAANPTAVVDGPVGIAINGVPIFNPCKQGGCQNGDTKILGELDVCNGHAGRADDYHYHAAPTCLMAGRPASYWSTHPIGWALDGFAILGYDDPDGRPAARDGICGGNTTPVPGLPTGYAYHVSDAAPYVMSCLRGIPSPDLAGQGTKFSPIRQPPVTPFEVSDMTLSRSTVDDYHEVRFSSSRPFTTTELGSDRYENPPGAYRIRYRPVTGDALAALLTQARNRGKTACWSFQFTNDAGARTQPDAEYCR